MSVKIIEKFASQNFDYRERGPADMIVIHSTHLQFNEWIRETCEPGRTKLSAHYVIDLDGGIYRIVQEEFRAWHAGLSYWRGREALNDYSIGIELVDTDHNVKRISRFTQFQMNAVISLCKDIIKRLKAPPYNIVAHSDIAPSRKDDPGENFDWKLLAEHGVGTYHSVDIVETGKSVIAKYGDNTEVVRELQKLLSAYGYKIKVNGIFDAEMRDVVIAFKRHFYQERMDDVCDLNFQKILQDLLSKSRHDL